MDVEVWLMVALGRELYRTGRGGAPRGVGGKVPVQARAAADEVSLQQVHIDRKSVV